MMDRFREGLKGPVAWVFLAVIIIPFIFGGISNFLVSGDTDVVAEVDGNKIRRADFDRAYAQTKDRYGDMYSRIFNTEEKEREFRKQIVDMLIEQQALNAAIKDMNMRMTPADVAARAQSFPAFQRDGKFSRELAESLLAQNGMTISSLQAQLEQDMLAAQLLRGISESAFVLNTEADAFYQLENEFRSGRFVRVTAADFQTTDAPSDEDMASFYEKNQESFRIPEQLALQYIELQGDALTAQVSATDAELQAYYDAHKSEYSSPEKRRVSHILLTSADSEGSDGDKAVLTRIEALKARLDKGEDFAALAREASEDPVSQEQGGELEPLEPGTMDEAFEKAAFALSKTQVLSAPVRSQFGYHLIKLLDLAPGETLAFESVKADIEKAMKAEKASNLFAEKQQQLEEKAYEVADGLDEAAALAGLTVQETGLFMREQPLGIAALPGVMEAVSSDEVMLEKRNSALLTVGDAHAVVVRLKEHKPSVIKSLTDVRSEVVLQVQQEKARNAARDFANTVVAKVRSGEDISAQLAEKNLNWEGFDGITRNSPAPDASVRQQIFKLVKPKADKATIASVELTGGDYVLAQLDSVKPVDITDLKDVQRQTFRDRLSRSGGQGDYTGLVAVQKGKASITRNDVKVNAVVSVAEQ